MSGSVIRPKGTLSGLQPAAVQRLGGGKVALVAQQGRKVVDAMEGVLVIGAESDDPPSLDIREGAAGKSMSHAPR